MSSKIPPSNIRTTAESSSESDSQIDSDARIETRLQHEILRQATWAFNCHLISLAIFISMVAVGGVLLLSAKTTEAAFTAVASLSGAYGAQTSKESQERLDLLMQRLENLKNT